MILCDICNVGNFWDADEIAGKENVRMQNLECRFHHLLSSIPVGHFTSSSLCLVPWIFLGLHFQPSLFLIHLVAASFFIFYGGVAVFSEWLKLTRLVWHLASDVSSIDCQVRVTCVG